MVTNDHPPGNGLAGWRTIPERIKPWLEVATYLVAIIGAGIVVWQTVLTRESLELTRESNSRMMALERPRVVVEPTAQPSLSSRSDPIVAQVSNVGRSVAQSVQVSTSFEGSEQGTELPCTWSDKRMAASALGSGQDTSFTTVGLDITPEMAYSVIGQKQKLFLWFSVSYIDPLSVVQVEPPLCFVVTGRGVTRPDRSPTNPWRRCESGDFKAHARVNCD